MLQIFVLLKIVQKPVSECLCQVHCHTWQFWVFIIFVSFLFAPVVSERDFFCCCKQTQTICFSGATEKPEGWHGWAAAAPCVLAVLSCCRNMLFFYNLSLKYTTYKSFQQHRAMQCCCAGHRKPGVSVVFSFNSLTLKPQGFSCPTRSYLSVI